MERNDKLSYKKTDISWMPEIPEHWEVRRLKNVFYDNKVKNTDSSISNVLSLSYGSIIRRNMENNQGLWANNFNAYQVVNKNDIILRLTDLQNDKKSLRVGLVKETGIITSAYTGLKILNDSDSSAEYFYYLLHAYDINTVFYGLGSGVRQSLGFTELKSLQLLIPPYQEQLTIANYLDSQLEKIKYFIHKKQAFIELLKEQRQAVINKAVTQGINPDVKLKDSGIHWLGDIPEHWEVRRLASMGRFSKGGNVSKGDLVQNGEKAVILYGDIYTKYEFSVSVLINKISKEIAVKATQIFKGDLLFTGSGEDKEDIGKCVTYLGDEEAYAGGDVIVFRQNEFDSELLSYSQNSIHAKYQKCITSKGDIIVHQYGSKLKNILMPFPSDRAEQAQIVSHIKTATATIDQTIAKAQREIELIKEYQHAMIAEAVAGKLNHKILQSENESQRTPS